MSSEVSISVTDLGKAYRIYHRPQDRLLQMFRPGKPRYDEYWALRGVDLHVDKGETVGIIGVNGSGKSTLLQILAGTLNPTSGSVEVNGRLAALLELGAGFNPEFTGKENVYLNGSLLGLTKQEIDDRYDTICAFADIGTFVDEPVKTYSSGMYVRLAFAIAVHAKPEILIIDEALAVGDIFFQQKCNLFMQEELGGVTKLLVTHDMGSIAKMAERAIVLERGRKIFEGDPLAAIEEYTKVARGNKSSAGFREDPAEEPAELPSTQNETPAVEATIDWTGIPEDKLSGELAARISHFRVTVDGKEYDGFIQPGATVECGLRLQADRHFSDVLFGYLAADRHGLPIFGDNSASLDHGVMRLPSGQHEVRLTFDWPEIADGDYFLTFGVGEGRHEIDHVIQCWAHNVFRLTSAFLTGTTHGLFTNPLGSCTVDVPERSA